MCPATSRYWFTAGVSPKNARTSKKILLCCPSASVSTNPVVALGIKSDFHSVSTREAEMPGGEMHNTHATSGELCMDEGKFMETI